MNRPRIEPVSRTGTPRTGRPPVDRPGRALPAAEPAAGEGGRWGDVDGWPRPLRIAARILLWLSPIVLLAALAVVVLYVRLLQGPVSLKFMAQPVERAVTGQLDGVTAKVGETLLQLGEDGDLEFRLVNLKLFEADGSVVASAPVAAVWLDLGRLLRFEILPRRVDLIEPRVSVVYSQRDGLALSFTEPDAPPSPQSPPNAALSPAAPLAAGGKPASGAAGMLQKLDLARVIAEFSARARRQEDATSRLAQIGLRNAAVDIDYEGRRSSWKVEDLAVDLDHRRRGSVISANARVASDRGAWTLSLLTEDSERTGTLTLKASVRDLVPSTIGRAFPNLALLRSLELPVAGNAAIRFKTSGELNGADFAVEVGRGLLDFGAAMSAPMLIDAALFNFNFDAARERFSIESSTARWGDSSVTLKGEVVKEPESPSGASWAFDIRSTSGVLAAEEFNVPPIPLDSLAVNGRITPASNRIEFASISASAGNSSALFSGEVVAGDDDRAGSRIEGRFGPAEAGVIKAFWPRMMAPRARQWAGEHLTAATLRDGSVRFTSGAFAPPGSPISAHGKAESVMMDVAADNVSLLPVKNGPPISASSVNVSLRNRALEITAPQSAMGSGVALKSLRFAVQDVDAPIADAELSFKMQSTLGPALDVARQLQLLKIDNFAVAPEKIQGKIDGDFLIRLPLLPEIEADTVAVTGKAKITDVKSKEKIGNVNVQSGAVDVQFTPEDATAKGELILNGVVAKVDWRRQTPPGAVPVTSPLTLTATLDNADRRQLGLDVSDFLDGDVPVTVILGSADAASPGGTRVVADITPADFSISAVAWKKPRGRPGRIEFDVWEGPANTTELRNFKISGDTIAAQGVITLAADQSLQEFQFPALSLNTVSRLEISGKRGPRDIMDVSVKGSTFDGRDFFRSLFTSGTGQGRKGAAKKGGIDVRVSIDNLLGYSDTSLRNFSMKMSKRGDRLTALDARGGLDSGKALIAILQAEGNEARKIIADTTDAGQTLRLVGFYPNMQGGRGRMDIYLDGRDSEQTSGVLIIEDFKVLGDPIVSEVVSSASGEGPAIGSASYGQRRVVREVFEFDRMRLPFSVGYGQFAIEESYLRGPLLGATLRGKVDYAAQTVNVGGTYIPLQGLNNALGGIPVLGQILSGPRGEGIFGITFAVQGAMSNPQVIVNPLSLVAPGIFREMFQMTNPSTDVQPRAPSPANVPIKKRVRASSSGGAYEAPETVDGWSSDTVVPSKKN